MVKHEELQKIVDQIKPMKERLETLRQEEDQRRRRMVQDSDEYWKSFDMSSYIDDAITGLDNAIDSVQEVIK